MNKEEEHLPTKVAKLQGSSKYFQYYKQPLNTEVFYVKYCPETLSLEDATSFPLSRPQTSHLLPMPTTALSFKRNLREITRDAETIPKRKNARLLSFNFFLQTLNYSYNQFGSQKYCTHVQTAIAKCKISLFCNMPIICYVSIILL